MENSPQPRQRSVRDIIAGASALAALTLVAIVTLAIVAVILWAIFASWKIVLGFAIGAFVIAAVSIGTRRR